MRILAGARFNHIGIPTTGRFEGEIDLPHLKITVSDHQDNPFGIQWQRYWEDSPCPDLVKSVQHPAFEDDDLALAMADDRWHFRADYHSRPRAIWGKRNEDPERRLVPARDRCCCLCGHEHLAKGTPIGTGASRTRGGADRFLSSHL